MCAMEETARRAIWLRDDDFMAHDVPGHPERPARIRALEAEMSAAGWFGASRVQAVEVERSLLLPVHPEEHVAFLEELCAAGGGAIDADTYAVPGDVRRRPCGPRAVRCSWSTRCWAERRTWA